MYIYWKLYYSNVDYIRETYITLYHTNNNLKYIFCIQENAANFITSDICFGVKRRNNVILSSVDFLDKSPVPSSSS